MSEECKVEWGSLCYLKRSRSLPDHAITWENYIPESAMADYLRLRGYIVKAPKTKREPVDYYVIKKGDKYDLSEVVSDGFIPTVNRWDACKFKLDQLDAARNWANEVGGRVVGVRVVRRVKDSK